VPVDETIRSLFPLVEGLPPFEEVLGNPEVAARMQEFETDPEPYTAPAVATQEIELGVGPQAFRARVYGTGNGESPCLVWSHGGAFMAGDFDMNEADVVSREVATRGDAVVLSVDYSLVPAVRFPVPHQQVMAAWTWAHDNATSLGVDRHRISMGGASAGAALSLSAVRDLAQQGLSVPAALILAYPVAHRRWRLDPVLEAAMGEIPPILRISPALVELVNSNYLGDSADTDLAFVDAEAGTVTGLPPTLVIVCEFDDLRATGDLLVTQAMRGGCRVERLLASGMLHGHLNRTPVIAEVDRTLAEITRVVELADVRAQ
jgi:acetyl esterase/lipase